MSHVIAAPDMVAATAADAAAIGSSLSEANMAAAASTTRVIAAAGDEVSAAIASLFSSHARAYQALSAQAAAFHDQFVHALNAGAAAYASTEAANAGPLQTLEQDALKVINAPTQAGAGGLLGSGGTGGNEQSIVIDFVRHGQSVANAAGLFDTSVPGTGLTLLGQQQAQAIANMLAGEGPYAGIYASQLIRTQETAAPLANLLGINNVQVLPGLNELYAGAFNGLPQISPAGLLYLVGPVTWTLGLPLVPMLAPGAHINGLVFDQRFTAALQTMYGNAMTNPVEAADGKITDVAFSSEFAIEVGTMMNVNNPDPLLMLTHPMPNTGVVVVQGDPQDGWTLVSWDGIPVPPASLPTKLFVDVRDLITAPQFAAHNIWEALPTGDPTTIVNAIRDGVDEVGTATVQFPLAVTRDLVEAVGGSSLGGLSTDLTNLLA
jgi:hypothetical protein